MGMPKTVRPVRIGQTRILVGDHEDLNDDDWKVLGACLKDMDDTGAFDGLDVALCLTHIEYVPLAYESEEVPAECTVEASLMFWPCGPDGRIHNDAALIFEQGFELDGAQLAADKPPYSCRRVNLLTDWDDRANTQRFADWRSRYGLPPLPVLIPERPEPEVPPMPGAGDP